MPEPHRRRQIFAILSAVGLGMALVLLIAVAVLQGVGWLFEAMGDDAGARFARRAVQVCLVLWIIDLILLVLLRTFADLWPHED